MLWTLLVSTAMAGPLWDPRDPVEMDLASQDLSKQRQAYQEARVAPRALMWSGLATFTVGAGILTAGLFQEDRFLQEDLVLTGAVVGSAGLLMVGSGGLTEAAIVRKTGAPADFTLGLTGATVAGVGAGIVVVTLLYAPGDPRRVGSPWPELFWSGLGVLGLGAVVMSGQPFLTARDVGRAGLAMWVVPSPTGIGVAGVF